MEQVHTYTRDDVLRLGFEALCMGVDGARYLWHGECGLIEDPQTGTRLLMDPADMPDRQWVATAWGQEELAEVQAAAT
ncbi:MAG TPA: hypothetical protein VFD50_01690 [Thermoleophilia bacterium]|nr:hypothetical protein [Thermoleophilia bacterium]